MSGRWGAWLGRGRPNRRARRPHSTPQANECLYKSLAKADFGADVHSEALYAANGAPIERVEEWRPFSSRCIICWAIVSERERSIQKIEGGGVGWGWKPQPKNSNNAKSIVCASPTSHVVRPYFSIVSFPLKPSGTAGRTGLDLALPSKPPPALAAPNSNTHCRPTYAWGLPALCTMITYIPALRPRLPPSHTSARATHTTTRACPFFVLLFCF